MAIPKHWPEERRTRYKKVAAEYRRKYRLAHPLEEKAYRQKYKEENPEKFAAYNKKRRIRNVNVRMKAELKFHYEITVEQYEEISLLQDHVCLICRTFIPSARAKRLFLDHDHSTGELRALLCHFCNAGLGYFKENIQLFERAIQYVQEFGKSISSDPWPDRVRKVLGALSEESSETASGDYVE